jgi:hypothetical protein
MGLWVGNRGAADAVQPKIFLLHVLRKVRPNTRLCYVLSNRGRAQSAQETSSSGRGLIPSTERATTVRGRATAVTAAATMAWVNVAIAEPAGTTGLGATTCGEFAEHYTKDPNLADLMYGSWAQGFMSGWNLELASARHVYRDFGRKNVAGAEFLYSAVLRFAPIGYFRALFFMLPIRRR